MGTVIFGPYGKYPGLDERLKVLSGLVDAMAEEADDRAEELRAKLAETRASEEPSPVEPAEAPESVEERRRRVHEEGRAAIDQMNDG